MAENGDLPVIVQSDKGHELLTLVRIAGKIEVEYVSTSMAALVAKWLDRGIEVWSDQQPSPTVVRPEHPRFLDEVARYSKEWLGLRVSRS